MLLQYIIIIELSKLLPMYTINYTHYIIFKELHNQTSTYCSAVSPFINIGTKANSH